MTAGILAHLVGSLPYRELAKEIAAREFPYVQLALSKAITDVDFSLGRLSPGLGNEVGGAFDKHGVRIAVLGCYASLIELDDGLYRHNVERFKEHLRHARHFGAPIVATEVGVPPSKDPSLVEKHWSRLHAAMDELVEEAERWGVTIGLEAAQNHLIDSPETLARTIERYPSSSVGVVMDPCNMMGSHNFYRQEEVIREAFRLLGPRIVSAHAKDLKRDSDGVPRETAAGSGELRYELFFDLLEKQKPLGFVTLEAVTEENMREAARFVAGGRAAAR